MGQPVGMMLALGIARDLGADDAGGIGVAGRAADPADAVGARRSTSSAQVLGQSCGQTEGTMSRGMLKGSRGRKV